jgi:integrase
MGSVFQRGSVWWLKYRAHDRIIRESSGSPKESDAKTLLKLREGAATEGRPVIPRVEKVTVGQLPDGLKAEYEANGRRSLQRLTYSLAHLRPVFGSRRAVHVTATDVTFYVTTRQAAQAKNATINRELAALKKAYSLALAAERIHRAPRFRMLPEDNVRQGFFERDAFEAMRRLLPDELRGLVTVAYITGWRIQSALLPLRWRQVDCAAGILRLEPGTTKNRDGRVFVMTPELRATLEAQRAMTEALQRKRGGHSSPGCFTAAGSRLRGSGRPGRRPGSRPGSPAHPARPPADGRAEPRAGRCPALGGHEARRPQDGGDLAAVRDRRRGHAAGGRREARAGTGVRVPGHNPGHSGRNPVCRVSLVPAGG